MFKRFFSLSNPVGMVITAAAIILSVSPEARKGTRKVLVKGVAALLSVGDQVKQLTIGARKELGTFVEEAKEEKDQMDLPDFSEMVKHTGEATKLKVSKVVDNMKSTMEKTTFGLSHSMEMGEEFIENTFEEPAIPKAPVKKRANKMKKSNSEDITLQQNVQNVLSNETYNHLIKKPPIQ
jgi:hypothetical protein